ncbi:MAG: zinc ribbon domain-containing protein [Abditibacteriales bacterium]|nr:zinc ribbon domain-containing protein [Abditibacteriales bacterium]MDW8366463.1 zinc ribbon domain-containing protein [Abditibacteriales bacterium]
MQTRTYAVEKTDLQGLAQRLGNWMEERGLEIQILQEGKNLITVQGRRQSLARMVLGTCYALTVKLSATTEGFEASVGSGQWIDKLTAGSIIVMAATRLRPWAPAVIPTLATAGYGFYYQQRLIKDAWRVIEDYVAEATGKRRKVSVPISVGCPKCNTVNPGGHSFCVKCGTRLPSSTPTVPHCSACGQILPSDAQFCPRCGKATQQPTPTA